jgi:hypothetical protein
VNIPNRDNIDRWLFDWTEGNLSPSQEIQLEEFLTMNPDLEIDADAWTAATVSSIPFSYEKQASLRKRKKHILAYWQFYAAALFLLFLGSGLYLILNAKGQTAQPLAKTTSSQLKTNNSNNSKKAVEQYKNKRNTTATTQQNGAPSTLTLVDKKNTTITIPTTKISTTVISKEKKFDSLADYELLKIEDSKITLGVGVLPINSLLVYQLEENQLAENDLTNYSLIQGVTTDTENNSSESNDTESNDTESNDTESNDTERNKKRASRTRSFSIKLNPSSKLAQWTKKELTNTNQKERIYAMPEKSNLDLNSSFVGNTSQLKFQSMSTARWISSNEQQKVSQQIALDGYVRKAKSGFGVVANYSNFSNGLIQDWNINLICAPKLAINRYITIEPSMKYTFGKKALDQTKIVNNSVSEFQTNHLETFSINPNLPVGKNLWYRDLGAGMIVNAGPVYFGAQLNNLLRHQDNLYSNDYSSIRRANSELTLVGGTDFNSTNGNFTFSPYVFHTISDAISNTHLGASIRLKSFILGGTYQTNGSSSALIGLHAERFALFCQTSYVNSSFNQQKSFIHQLTFRINSNISKKTRRYLYL